MKGFAGTVIAVARELARSGVVPRRDLVLAFLADEEAGRRVGRKWLVENRPELFAGVTEAIGEVGGSPCRCPRRTTACAAYLLATAEKGAGWLRLRARGAAGHASTPGADTAVLRLARAVVALGEHRFPVERTDVTTPFLTAFSELTGHDRPENGLVCAGLRHSAVPTMLTAGYKLNVIPGEAVAEVDTRVVPGGEAGFRREVERIVGEYVDVEWAQLNAPVVAPVDGPLVETVRAAVAHDDPDGVVVPYLLPASTTTRASPGSASRATDSPRCGCPTGSTPSASSTPSTNACRSRRCGSGPVVMRRILRTA